MKRILCYFLFFCVCIYMQAQTYDQLAARAVEAAERDSLELSEKLFEEALKLEPANMRNSMLFSNLGTVQHRLGKIDKAIESYTLGLNLAPYSVTILLNRAALYLEKNLYEKAYLDYCNVIDIDRKNQEALLYRAYIYMQRRDYKEARIDYNTLLQEEPKNKMGGLGMALLNQKELKFPEALEEFLANEKVLKIGLSLRDDFGAMRKRTDIQPANFLDLQNYVGQFGIEDASLQKIYAILFNKKISKGQRLSNWEADVLSDAQKKYAALDAWACLKIYNQLKQI